MSDAEVHFPLAWMMCSLGVGVSARLGGLLLLEVLKIQVPSCVPPRKARRPMKAT